MLSYSVFVSERLETSIILSMVLLVDQGIAATSFLFFELLFLINFLLLGFYFLFFFFAVLLFLQATMSIEQEVDDILQVPVEPIVEGESHRVLELAVQEAQNMGTAMGESFSDICAAVERATSK